MSVFKKTTEPGSGKKKPILAIKPPPIPLQKYLDKAYREAVAAGPQLGPQTKDALGRERHLAISIIAHANTGTAHHYAGIHDDEVHFSASLLKVAAMYAAFSLRAEAKALAAAGSFANATAFFTALKQEFKSTDALPAIRNLGVFLEPRYTDILTATGFGGVGATTVEFVPSFYHGLTVDHGLYQDYLTVRANEHLPDDRESATSLAALAKVSHMYKMIVPSNNFSAGECIRRLGYAYINVKLMNKSFYDPASSPPKGIWLAADYGGSPRVEIDSVNDGKVAQATTTLQMTRFFSLVMLGDLPGSPGMKELLKEAHTVDEAWISRFGTRLFDVEGVKVGVANLKPNNPPLGPDVYSEGLLLKWSVDAEDRKRVNVNGDIAVCWQNLRVSEFDAGVPAIAQIIETAFSDFLAQIPA